MGEELEVWGRRHRLQHVPQGAQIRVGVADPLRSLRPCPTPSLHAAPSRPEVRLEAQPGDRQPIHAHDDPHLRRTYDALAPVDLLPNPPAAGSFLQGSFWLVGSVVDGLQLHPKKKRFGLF